MRPVLLSGVVVAVAALVAGCSGTHETLHDRPAATATVVPAVPVLNVPSLLSLTIDEMSRRVGPRLPVPGSFIDPTLVPLMQRNEPMDSTSLFRYRGLSLVAAYDHQSRRINDLLLLGGNESELMRRAQLELGAAHYLVLPVFQTRPATQLLGLRVLSTKPTLN